MEMPKTICVQLVQNRDGAFMLQKFDINNVFDGGHNYVLYSQYESIRRENEELKAKHCDAMRQLDKANWQPIETAPRDGTEIIICSPLDWDKSASEIDDPNVGTGNYIGAFRFVKNVWKNRLAFWTQGDRPTHWMPP